MNRDINYNIFYILLLSIVCYLIDLLTGGKFYKYLKYLDKIPKYWQIIIVFLVFYLPKLIYRNNTENSKNIMTIYEPFNLFPKKKRRVTANMKKHVAASQLWNCNMCNNMLDATYEVDHIHPLYKGGGNELSNLQALCRNCHGKKTLSDSLQ